jgi:hypothetical protein
MRILDAHFEAAGDAGGALVGAHRAGDHHGGFLRQVDDLVEQLGGQVALEGHALGEAIAIPQQQEDQLALVGAVVHPALQGHFLTLVLGEIGYADDGGHGYFLLF